MFSTSTTDPAGLGQDHGSWVLIDRLDRNAVLQGDRLRRSAAVYPGSAEVTSCAGTLITLLPFGTRVAGRLTEALVPACPCRVRLL